MADAEDQEPDNSDQTDSDQPDASWQFKPGDQPAGNTTKSSDIEPVSWTASEFIAHAKNSGWYMVLIIVTVLVAGLIFLITRGVFNVVIIVIAGVVFGVMASRQPRELPYTVSDQGIQIGSKEFKYTTFRTFSIVQEGGIESIWFMPLKRFMPIVTIYFEPQDQQKIVDVIANYLPMENRQLDPVDKLMHKIRF